MKVSEVMNKGYAVEENVKLRQAAKIMSEKRIGSLIITGNGEITGILTENDVVRNVEKLDKKVSETMTKKVITIEEDENLDEAARIMAKNKIKRLPVVKNDKLVGIVTATDIIANSEELNEEFFFD